MADKEETCKLLILGDEKVGKTTLLKRLECGEFVHVEETVIEGVALTDFIERTYDFDGRKIVLQVWDTAGGERYDSITTQYFRAAQGYILAYDITQEKTFEVGVRRWKKQIDTNAGAFPKILLAGTKLDLESERAINYRQAELYKNESDLTLFFETSAKTGENVEKAFEVFLREICAVQDEKLPKNPDSVNLRSPDSSNSSKCC